MIDNLTFFENAEDLEKLTGLTHNELWDAGFDLDDFDFGFVSDENYSETLIDEWGLRNYQPKEGIPSSIWWILLWMSNRCVGYKATEYNGKYYYMSYHS